MSTRRADPGRRGRQLTHCPTGDQSERAPDRRQRGTELVADHGHELALQPVDLFQHAVGLVFALAVRVIEQVEAEVEGVLRLMEEVYAVLDGWAARTHDPRPGTLPVNVFTAAFPRTP